MLGLLMIKAYKDEKEAERKNKRANRIIREANVAIKTKQKACISAIDALSSKKLQIFKNSMKRFVASFEKLREVGLTQSEYNEFSKFQLDAPSFIQLKDITCKADSIIVQSLVTGGLLGLALGTFGGIVGTGFGIYEVAKASSHLDEARGNLAKARRFSEELETSGALCNGIRRRAYMFFRLLVKLDALFLPLVVSMERAIQEHGTDFRTFSEAEKQSVSGARALAGAIKAVLDTPILTEDGNLTEQSAQVADDISAKLLSR